jgi:uncharacterized membrane protein YozB (DUF420 family)
MRDPIAVSSMRKSEYVRVPSVWRRSSVAALGAVILCSAVVVWMAKQEQWRNAMLAASTSAAKFIVNVNQELRSSSYSR